MTSGGARNRSGPPADPNSLNSADKGVVFTALPSEGYDGKPPAFPLPEREIYTEHFEGSGRNRERVVELDEHSTEAVWSREQEFWAQIWKTPQACAWARESWRWPTIAMYVRTFVICEGAGATAADKGSLHRFADQIGLTPAGLAENGWAIAKDAVAEKRGAAAATKKTAAKKQASARDRMKVVQGGKRSS